jgi:hypothetical protein
VVLNAHTISEVPEDTTSSQGAEYLRERYCPEWANFIAASTCDPTTSACSEDDDSGSAVYVGCFVDNQDFHDLPHGNAPQGASTDAEAISHCAQKCAGYKYMGIQLTDQCYCGDQYGTYGAESSGCDCETLSEQDCILSRHGCPGHDGPDFQSSWMTTQYQCNAVYKLGTSDSWNVISDGGSDMYDIGNLLSTSLMGDCTSDPHNCPLGSLHYHRNFESVATDCFGTGGSYQMAKLEGVWVFVTHNAGDEPLDFIVAGNLGSDHRGTVTEYVFEVRTLPFIGFGGYSCILHRVRLMVNH